MLDGGSVIELKDSAGLADGTFTLSLWFNPYELTGGQQILAGKNRYALKERQWSLIIELTAGSRPIFNKAAGA